MTTTADLATMADKMAAHPPAQLTAEQEAERALAAEHRRVSDEAAGANEVTLAKQREEKEKVRALVDATEKTIKTPFAVRKGRVRTPRRTVIYGPPGVGKTTLAADIDDAIMFDADDGSQMLEDLSRFEFYPDDPVRGHVPRTYEDLQRGVKMLGTTTHPYRNLILDSLDRIEAMIIRFCLRRDSVGRDKPLDGLEGYGFNKGPQIILDEARHFFAMLDRLVAKGIGITILAHSTVTKFSNPGGLDWDRFGMKCGARLAGFVGEWADEVGFFHYEEGATKEDKNQMKKAKGWSTGARVLEFDRTAAWDAKARLPLPPRVEVGIAHPWAPMRAAQEQAYTATAADLRALIVEQCARIGDGDTTAKVTAAVLKEGESITRLAAFLSELRRRPAIESDDNKATTDTEES